MPYTNRTSRFQPGRLVATPGVMAAVSRADLMNAFQRHLQCDWGSVSAGDWAKNEQALQNGNRLFSVYHSSEGQKFWIITEADRSATTVLLPEEY